MSPSGSLPRPSSGEVSLAHTKSGCAGYRSALPLQPYSGPSGRFDHGAQRQGHVGRIAGLGRVTFEAYAQDLLGDLTEAQVRLYVPLFAQAGADVFGVQALGHGDGGDHGQPVLGLRERLEAQRFDPLEQQPGAPEVALEGILQPFLQEDAQRLMGSVHERYGRGVVVGFLHPAAPVAHELLDVEVVGVGLLLAVVHLPHRPLAEGYGRPSRRYGETLLGARVTGVYAPLVHADVHPPSEVTASINKSVSRS